MNYPKPIVIIGDTLEQALRLYEKQIFFSMAEGVQNGCPLRVHTIQIIPPATIVCFVDNDEASEARQAALQMINRVNGELGNAGCQHEYDTNLTCIHCGSKLS
jgi:hypothetical protein